MRIIIVTLIILALGLLELLNPVRDAFQGFFAPVQFGLRKTAISVKDSSRLFYNLNDIRKENLGLLRENQELRGIIVDLKKAEEENTVLRSQLDLKNSAVFDKDLLLASVMGNPDDLTGTSLLIDKGSRQGVQPGDNVIIGNFLVGIVSDTSGERSIIDLVISPEVSMTVENINLSASSEGLAKGDHGTSVKVSRLLQSDVVEVGDVFVTTGKDGRFLPGLSVGSVTDVTFQSADPLKTATLNPMVDFSNITKVFVILTR